MVSNVGGLNDDGVGLGVGGTLSAPGWESSASCLDGTSCVCDGVHATASGPGCLFNPLSGSAQVARFFLH